MFLEDFVTTIDETFNDFKITRKEKKIEEKSEEEVQKIKDERSWVDLIDETKDEKKNDWKVDGIEYDIDKEDGSLFKKCNICYKRKLFKGLGYLRKDMKVAEDCEFHYRCSNAGYTIFYNPKMVAYHYERPTKIGWIKKAIKNGYGRYELNNIHPSLKDRHEHSMKSKNIIRLIFGAIGYIKAMVMVEKKR